MKADPPTPVRQKRGEEVPLPDIQCYSRLGGSEDDALAGL